MSKQSTKKHQGKTQGNGISRQKTKITKQEKTLITLCKELIDPTALI